MFNIAEKTDLNQISLTGIRALVLIGLLITKPRSLDEIREEFINLQIMEESHSDDILRIDLNTIKIMGCEISRSSAKTNHKYILSKHPFSFKISEEELNALKKVYNFVKSKSDLNVLLEYDKLFKKIALHICDEESREAMLGVSVFKYYDINMIKDLIIDCKHNRILDLLYKKPNKTNDVKKQIIAQEIVCKNDKIYLYGYDLKKEKSVVLNLRRLKSIIARSIKKQSLGLNQTKIKFIVKNLQQEELDVHEEIIDSTVDGYVVEGSYHNEFLATQRVLSLGARCIVIEPIEFRNSVIEKIKEMRKTYEC